MHFDRPNRLFIHGAGRRGSDAWPAFDEDDGEFLSFPDGSAIAEQASAIRDGCATGRTTLFAHSIGAVPASLAVAEPVEVVGLVLVEPALYDIARGDAAIERHIAAVTEARAIAALGDLRGFWALLRPLMFGGSFDEARWEDEKPVAERWAVTNVPWGHGVRASMLDGLPALVVTGGWNAEYETIAEVLAAHGAEHRVLSGAGHRPQDMAGFADLVAEFESA